MALLNYTQQVLTINLYYIIIKYYRLKLLNSKQNNFYLTDIVVVALVEMEMKIQNFGYLEISIVMLNINNSGIMFNTNNNIISYLDIVIYNFNSGWNIV